MASFSGFIRKSPDARLASFLSAKGVDAPDDFNWQSEGRGKALVDDINGLIAELPEALQDRVKAELDLFAIAVSPDEAARLAGIGRTSLYAALAKGDLKSIKIGTRRLIKIEAIHEWLASYQTDTE